MKKIIALLLVLSTVFSMTGCGGKKKKEEYKEKFDAGLRYMQELDYDNAIHQFDEAVKIDPKQEAAYVGLAGAQYRSGETEKAKETISQGIEKSKETDILEQSKEQIDNGTFSPDSATNRANAQFQVKKTDKVMDDYGRYYILGYDENKQQVNSTYYNADGSVNGYFTYECDEYGNIIDETAYDADGIYLSCVLYSYDSQGRVIERIFLDENFQVVEIAESQYDSYGLRTDYVYDYYGNFLYEIIYDDLERIAYIYYYNAYGIIVDTNEYEYDEDGNLSSITYYNMLNIIKGYQLFESDRKGNLKETRIYLADGTLVALVNENESWTRPDFEEKAIMSSLYILKSALGELLE